MFGFGWTKRRAIWQEHPLREVRVKQLNDGTWIILLVVVDALVPLDEIEMADANENNHSFTRALRLRVYSQELTYDRK